jgi:hypothetical protein
MNKYEQTDVIYIAIVSFISGSIINGAKSPPSNKAAFNIKPGTPGTPGSNRIHSIASLTPYQNRLFYQIFSVVSYFC